MNQAQRIVHDELDRMAENMIGDRHGLKVLNDISRTLNEALEDMLDQEVHARLVLAVRDLEIQPPAVRGAGWFVVDTRTEDTDVGYPGDLVAHCPNRHEAHVEYCQAVMREALGVDVVRRKP